MKPLDSSECNRGFTFSEGPEKERYPAAAVNRKRCALSEVNTNFYKATELQSDGKEVKIAPLMLDQCHHRKVGHSIDPKAEIYNTTECDTLFSHDSFSECLNEVIDFKEYAQPIHEYLLREEKRYPLRDYMKDQIEINETHRALAITWLVEVQETLELLHDTLYLSARIFDYFLSTEHVKKRKLQLIAATCCFIACKLEEKFPPSLTEFVQLCDGTYKKQEFIDMELKIVFNLDFKLYYPIAYRYLKLMAKCTRKDIKVLTLSRYICELSLTSYELNLLRPSQVAAASFLLSLRILGHWEPWTTGFLENYFNYSYEELEPITNKLNLLAMKHYNDVNCSIFVKYGSDAFFGASKVFPLPLHNTLRD